EYARTMHRFPYDAFSIRSQISEVMLTLKRTGKHFNQPWGANDFVVLDAGKVIGRIMLHPQTPKDRPWFWTIVARPKNCRLVRPDPLVRPAPAEGDRRALRSNCVRRVENEQLLNAWA